MKLKLPYEPPTIEKNVVRHASKFGYGAQATSCEEIDGISVASLVEQFGSPLFVYSEKTLRSKIRAARRAFEKRYPQVQFAWSYKTCYLKAVCATFHDEGSFAEVVSEFEYDKARRLGVPGHEILLNGPCKSRALLSRAVDDNANIHLDNFTELSELEDIVREKGVKVNAAIRINMDTGMLPAWNKFGFNLENGEALQAVRRLKSGGMIDLVGLHTHIGTFVMDTCFYQVASEKLIRLARQVKEECGFEIEYFDLGGGFASNNTLHSQYLSGERTIPSFDSYATAICDTFTNAFSDAPVLPKIYIETGRALVDEAGWMITSVLANKHTPDGRRALIADVGINSLYTTQWYRLKTMPARQVASSPSDTVLYGPLCMNIDVVRESVQLPPLDVGDQLVLHPVGAYNVVQSMQFITYRPAVVMIGNDGTCTVIRERENLEYVEEMERLPVSLNPKF